MSSMISVSALIVLPVFLILFLGIPILIGVYVYRDAKSRGMNAVLWTLIALFAPSFIGLIIYLLIRGSYSDLKCPICNTAVTEQYVVCPSCGAKLKASCPGCNSPIEAGWKVCPHCSTPLPEYSTDFTPPKKPKDRALGKILIAIIIIPIIFILLTFFAFLAFRVNSVDVEHDVQEEYEIDIEKEKQTETFSGLPFLRENI
ncbi:MAG: zinc ribbon domain-containing protein [Lachnospiraceae bacterium]